MPLLRKASIFSLESLKQARMIRRLIKHPLLHLSISGLPDRRPIRLITLMRPWNFLIKLPNTGKTRIFTTILQMFTIKRNRLTAVSSMPRKAWPSKQEMQKPKPSFIFSSVSDRKEKARPQKHALHLKTRCSVLLPNPQRQKGLT